MSRKRLSAAGQKAANRRLSDALMRQALAARDFAAMERLYRKKAKIPDDTLFDAIFAQDAELVQWLVDHGADVNYIDHTRTGPPLHYSITSGTPEITDILLACEKIHLTHPILMTAIDNGQEDLALRLIDMGTPIVAPGMPPGETLLLAAHCGMLRLTAHLIALGEPLTATRKHFLCSQEMIANLLEEAACGGNVALLDYLAGCGVPLDRYHVSPLILAVTYGRAEAVTWLLERGISPEIPHTLVFLNKPQEMTPLLLAAHMTELECFTRLLEAGADMYPAGCISLDDLTRELGDIAYSIFGPVWEAKIAHEDRVFDRIWRLERDLGFIPEPGKEHLYAQDGIPSLPLLDAQGKPTPFLLQIAGMNALGMLFIPEHWGPRQPEAKALLNELRAALPPHYRSRLDKVDATWMRRPPEESWAAKLQPKPPQTLPARER